MEKPLQEQAAQYREITISGQVLAVYSPITKDFHFYFSNTPGSNLETTDYIKVCDHSISFIVQPEQLIKRQLEIIYEQSKAQMAEAKADISKKFDEKLKILNLKLTQIRTNKTT